MKARNFTSWLMLLGCVTLAGCGPTQAELDIQTSQDAASLFARQTALALTDTSTPTASSTPAAKVPEAYPSGCTSTP
jgi:hypothetical protein